MARGHLDVVEVEDRPRLLDEAPRAFPDPILVPDSVEPLEHCKAHDLLLGGALDPGEPFVRVPQP